MSYPHDRAAQEPGGLECCECGVIFVGAWWHDQCAVCANNGWFPIDTAPKDRPILTYRDAGLIAVAEYYPNCGSEWCVSDGMNIVNVTHWRPLPRPPVSARGTNSAVESAGETVSSPVSPAAIIPNSLPPQMLSRTAADGPASDPSAPGTPSNIAGA